MAVKITVDHLVEVLKAQSKPVSSPELSELLSGQVAERTLRRWLNQLVDEGTVVKTGAKRGTRYQYLQKDTTPLFLKSFPEERRQQILTELKALWTHTSTSIEGNTLTLGETREVLAFGLTVGGKPLKDHLEITGHARAIDLLYESLDSDMTVEQLFELHKIVQIETVKDIYRPVGNWKVEPNGTYTVTKDDKQIYLEYARPSDVERLMTDFITELNKPEYRAVDVADAPSVYAKFHTGFVHVHPFFDGNGRMARLIANLPLLRSGLPPVVIDQSRRPEYIKLLASYELQTGQLTPQTGLWPNIKLLEPVEAFCKSCYGKSLALLE